MKLFLLQALVFLASFLIFQVELILGKVILPGFGGGNLVWGISVVFYQALLFLGYLYIHWINRYFRFKSVRKWQMVLLILSLLFLPLNVESLQNPTYQWLPVVEIVWMLAVTVGVMFLILSSISVYSQIHLSTTSLKEKGNPYMLFAASNLGAFASLLGYPLIWEPNFTIPEQILHWEVGYVLVVLLFGIVQVRVTSQPVERPLGSKMSACPPRQILKWLLLAAAPSAMFLAVTNEITINVAPVPLLWVIPLGIYLLTLVLSFMKRPFCPKYLQDRFYLFLSLGIVLFVFKATGNNPVEYGIHLLIALRSSQYWAVVAMEPLILLTLCFVFCLVCHFHLNQAKPEDSGQLTTYYIVLSAGGFLGGFIVNWMVPLVFDETIELLISFLIGVAGIMLVNPLQRKVFFRGVVTVAAILAVPLVWVVALNQLGPAAELLIALLSGSILLGLYYFLKQDARLYVASLAGIILVVPFLGQLSLENHTLLKERNYYGIYTVYETGKFLKMKHGTTLHGAQYLDEARRQEPLAYFHKQSPAGQVLGRRLVPVSKVALVGLGVGSLASYAQPGDRYDIFELDPLVGSIAQKYFSYLPEIKGDLRVVYGDARVSLRKEPDGLYDAVFIDVFNGGSIPVHLMTVEAIREYLRVLKPDGILCFHVTNAFLDLGPVLNSNARELGLMSAIKFAGITRPPPEEEATTWVLVGHDSERFRSLLNGLGWKVLDPNAPVSPWTDDYSSVWSAFRR
jgi:SAM-dependent methyltransferase